MNLDRIIFTWGVGNYGWGVVGINFLLHWPGVAMFPAPYPTASLPKGDPRTQLLADRLAQSSECWKSWPPTCPVFVGLGNEFYSATDLRGCSTVAFPVFEDVDIVRANVDRLRAYPLVITASRWNHDILADLGIKSRMVHQGYDPVLFHPGIRKKATDGRFHVYSGGKAEYRKGQDLVLEGFKIFAENHEDAVLHALWASPWTHLARTFGNTKLGGIPGADIGMPNYQAWAQKAGIKRHQFEVIPSTPNSQIPEVLAAMDCAVFASRFEGGTNISAMECIGCGIPTILSPGTGHADLFTGWRMHDNTPEDIATSLDQIYDDWLPVSAVANHQAAFGWPARIDDLVGVLNAV